MDEWEDRYRHIIDLGRNLPEFAQDPTFQQLFVNEARIGSQLQHQNLVGIQDFDREGEHFFLVMEYVEGITLRRVISTCWVKRSSSIRLRMRINSADGFKPNSLIKSLPVKGGGNDAWGCKTE